MIDSDSLDTCLRRYDLANTPSAYGGDDLLGSFREFPIVLPFNAGIYFAGDTEDEGRTGFMAFDTLTDGTTGGTWQSLYRTVNSYIHHDAMISVTNGIGGDD